jgi:hypothetical protein
MDLFLCGIGFDEPQWLTKVSTTLEVGEENGIVFVVPSRAGTQGTIGCRLAPQ